MAVISLLVRPTVGSVVFLFFFLMRRRPPRSTQSRSSAASDVYKRQQCYSDQVIDITESDLKDIDWDWYEIDSDNPPTEDLSLIHISEPTRPY